MAMKNISLYRIGLLFKRYFCENWKKDVIVASIIFAVEMLTSLNPGASAISWIVLFVFFILYSGHIFGMLGKPQKAINYLMLPASNGEKLTVNIILSHFYYPALLILASCLGIWASSFFCYRIYGEFEFKTINFVFTRGWHVYLFLLLSNAIMMFGSVYFRKAAVIKTLLCEAAFCTLYVIVMMVIFFKICNYDTDLTIDKIDASNLILYIFMLCVTVFFWILSYFRLKETEA
jgi:hypothetical protein